MMIWCLLWTGCGEPPAADQVGTHPPSVGLLVGTVVGGRGRDLVVRGCGAEAAVDPEWSTWALHVDRSAVPCTVTLYEGTTVHGGHLVVEPGRVAETLCVLRPSLGLVVRPADGGLVVVADHHPDALLRAGDRLVSVAGSGGTEGELTDALAVQRSPEEVAVAWVRDGLRETASRYVLSACDDPVAPRLWRGDGGPPVNVDRAPLSTTLF